MCSHWPDAGYDSLRTAASNFQLQGLGLLGPAVMCRELAAATNPSTPHAWAGMASLLAKLEPGLAPDGAPRQAAHWHTLLTLSYAETFALHSK